MNRKERQVRKSTTHAVSTARESNPLYRRELGRTIPSLPLWNFTRQSGQYHLAVRLGTSDKPTHSR